MTLFLPDHHIHTRYSRCATGKHDFRDVIQKLKSKRFPYYCVSDHIHYDNDDEYFDQHISIAQDMIKNGLDNPIFLGAEITIQDSKGRAPLQNKSLDHLNYSLMGDHYIPETPITMDNLRLARQILSEYFYKKPSELKKIFEITQSMYLNAIDKYKPTVLVHPFSTLLRADFTHKYLYEIFEKVCEMCQHSNTAIELNAVQIMECVKNPSNVLIEHPDMPSKHEFYRNLLHISLKYDLLYSPGSDAHVLNLVGYLDPIHSILEEFHISQKKILNFTQTHEEIKEFGKKKV